MDLYRERGWLTFGGGENIEVASQPALLEHNSNRFAFVGCNPAGPAGDWAGLANAGSQPCDWEMFRQQIRELREQGYLVIATLQYGESYVSTPLPQQVADFQSLSEAGATIVQGSQAHFPQGFGFLNGQLIHYGLGNLFFDQMDYPVVGTRREFLDRHVFYDGKHISTELMTAMLENYARPRPMTTEERQTFLQDIFTASGW
jgi:poly-gamma-glutamate capsule biosynthesis protein CapA/YwtB (metallophosphatase superfamily)